MSFYHINYSYDPTEAIGNEPEQYPGEPDWQTNEEEYDWRAWRNTVIMSDPPRIRVRKPPQHTIRKCLRGTRKQLINRRNKHYATYTKKEPR